MSANQSNQKIQTNQFLRTFLEEIKKAKSEGDITLLLSIWFSIQDDLKSCENKSVFLLVQNSATEALQTFGISTASIEKIHNEAKNDPAYPK